MAVSRAKHRLYVIGDHEAWSTLPYFRVPATKLECAAGGQIIFT